LTHRLTYTGAWLFKLFLPLLCSFDASGHNFMSPDPGFGPCPFRATCRF